MNIIVLDLETDNVDPLNPKLVGWAMKRCHKEIVYVDMRNLRDSEMLSQENYLLEALRTACESPDWIKVCHNLKFELAYLKSLGITMCPPYADTMVLAWILNMGLEKTETSGKQIMSYKLKELEHLWLNIDREDFKTLAKRFAVSVPTKRIKKDGTPCMRKRPAVSSEIPVEELALYCKADVSGTFQLYELMSNKMNECSIKVNAREMKLIPIYEQMERNGVLIDRAYLQQYEKTIDGKLDGIQNKLGTDLNLASPKQLTKLLYEELKLPILDKTKKGDPSTGKWAIKKLIRQSPENKGVLKDILEYRTWRKYRDTYVRQWIESVHPIDGRVHFSINPIGAHSGRISSRSQQIPKRTENAGDVRKAIIAPEGRVLCEFDYSQIEPRIMAHYSCDPKLLDIFNSGKDVYRYVAGAALRIDPDKITKAQRDIGKVLVLAINYGETAWGLADNLDISVEEAQSFLDNYFVEFPYVKIYQKEIILKTKKLGYIETIDGTRRKISSNIGLEVKWAKNKYGAWTDHNKWKRAEAERQALNLPIQGSAADIIKRAMIAIAPKLHKDIKLLLQIHDALLFEMPESRVKTAVPVIKNIMENVIKLKVKTPVGASVGVNLGSMMEV